MPPKRRNPSPQKPVQGLRIFGNYFIPEMRTVCALLDLNYVPFTPENLDIFSKEGRLDYLSLNPGDQYPTIIKGYQTIIADPHTLYKYLCRTEEIDQKFYPTKEMNRDKQKVIDMILENIQCTIKRCSDRLMKLKLQKLLLQKKLITKEESIYNENAVNEEIHIFQNMLLPNLEEHLEGGRPYVSGYDYSVADIAYFNQIQNVLMILNETIDSKKFPNTDKWMKRIEDITQIRVLYLKGQEEYRKLIERISK